MSLVAQNLRKVYKKRIVVKDVTITVNPGEIVGLLGPNGAGKTTTFYIIVGAIKSDGGSVKVHDVIIDKLPMYKRARLGIGYLPQEPSIFRNLTVEQNLWAILEMLPLTKHQRIQKAQEVITEMGLEMLRKSYAWQLSGGEKRRCEVARVLLTDPRYLLLDEPFVGIDPKTVNDIQEIMKTLKKKGLGILITDHNVRETLSITDRAYIMYDGGILLEGTAHDLINSPEAREVYLGEKFKM